MAVRFIGAGREYSHPCVAECILTDVSVRVEDRVGMTGGVTIMNENRQTMHCSHCSNIDSTYVLATICARAAVIATKLLTALDLTRGRVFFELARQRRQE